MAKNKNKNKNKRKNKIKSKKKRLDINKLKAVADAPLIESSSKNKSQYDRISLTTTPAQKMGLKERAKDADEISLSPIYHSKFFKKHRLSSPS